MTAGAVLCVPVLMAVGGTLHVFGNGDDAAPVLALASFAAAFGLTLNILDQGLRFTADEVRYRRYLDGVKSICEFFTHPDADLRDRLRAVFDLERLAYWETREFFNGHGSDHFFG